MRRDWRSLNLIRKKLGLCISWPLRITTRPRRLERKRCLPGPTQLNPQSDVGKAAGVRVSEFHQSTILRSRTFWLPVGLIAPCWAAASTAALSEAVSDSQNLPPCPMLGQRPRELRMSSPSIIPNAGDRRGHRLPDAHNRPALRPARLSAAGGGFQSVGGLVARRVARHCPRTGAPRQCRRMGNLRPPEGLHRGPSGAQDRGAAAVAAYELAAFIYP